MPVIIGIIAIVLQLTLIPLISFDFILPDILLIVLVYFTLLKGQLFGTVYGFILGFLFDIFSGGLIGSAMFSKTLAGFTAGYFFSENRKYNNLNSIFFVLIVFVCAVIDSLFFRILVAKDLTFTFTSLFVQKSFLPALYTAVLALLWLIFKPKRDFE